MDGKNALFRRDPFDFAQKYPINVLNLTVSQADTISSKDLKNREAVIRYLMGIGDQQGFGSFDLEPKSDTSFIFRWVFPGTAFAPKAPRAEIPLEAYWVPYVSIKTQGDGLANVPFVDLPLDNPQYDLMFTGSMNGCSLVITSPAGNPSVIRVYHDSKHLQDTFRNENVLLRLDYDASITGSRYFYAQGELSTAFNFLYYKNNCWYLVSQPQIMIPKPPDPTPDVILNADLPTFQVAVPLPVRPRSASAPVPTTAPASRPSSSSVPTATSQSLFPHPDGQFNYALSDEPILINGMKVIFDETVPVYPVTLVRKDSLQKVKEAKHDKR